MNEHQAHPSTAKSLHKLYFVVGVLLGLLILYAVGRQLSSEPDSGTSAVATKLSVAVPTGPASALVYIAANGKFSQHKVAINVIPFTSGRLAIDALKSGDAPIALAAETPILLSYLSGQSSTLVLSQVAASPHKAVYRKDRLPQFPKGIRGRKIGLLKGSAADYWLDLFLADNRVSRADVSVINLNPPDLVPAIIAGDIDIFLAWEPIASQATERSSSNLIAINSTRYYTQRFLVVSTREWVEANPKSVGQFLEALTSAKRFVDENPDRSIEIVASASGMETEVLRRFWDDHDFTIRAPASLEDSLIKQQAWAQSMLPNVSAYPKLGPLLEFVPPKQESR